MIYFINIAFMILLFDFLSIITTKIINKNIIINNNPNIRWFFIHSCSNILITYYSADDLINCLININNINDIAWSNNSYNTFWISILTHLYHIIFFKLTNDDILHHFTMVLIAGTIGYSQKSIICPAALFFLSGLPGAIDYFCLYLVKLDLMKKEDEKIIYLYLTTFLRSPGTCILSFINIYNNYNNLLPIINSVLVFWNGQYYLMKTSMDYGKFKEKLREIWIKNNKTTKFVEETLGINNRPLRSPKKFNSSI